MLIGIDASRASKKEKTGTEWYSYHLLRAMRESASNHRFLLYCKDGMPFELPAQWHEKKIAWPFNFLWTQGGLSLEMLRHRPDVLFVPSHAIPLIHPLRTVTTIHDIGFLDWKEYRSKKELRYLDWSTRYALRHCSKIITISEFTKKEMVRIYGVDEKKISVVYLGLDVERHDNEITIKSQVVLKKFHLSKPYLLFVGRIDSRKNIERLVSAYNLLRESGDFDGDLVIAGPIGYDGAKIMATIATSRFAKDIHCVGWISEDEKILLMREAHVFVFPSLYEGFGLPVIEAQSCGAPVVCSQITALPEIAGEGALFVDPLLPESIAEGVRKMIQDPNLSNTYRKQGRENAQKYSWRRCARETLTVLEN